MNYIEKQLKSRNILFVFLTVIMLGLAVMLFVLRYQEELKWREVQSWQKLPATVVSHQEKTSRNGKNNGCEIVCTHYERKRTSLQGVSCRGRAW